MELMTVCRTCGESWTPDHAAYVRGDWRTCSACRERAARLVDLTDAPPRPLPHLAGRQRDGPDRHPEPFRGPGRATGHPGAAQPRSWNHCSKGLKS